jgi:hypothetical protein
MEDWQIPAPLSRKKSHTRVKMLASRQGHAHSAQDTAEPFTCEEIHLVLMLIKAKTMSGN